MLLRWLTPGLVLLTAAALHSVDARLAERPSDPAPRPGAAGLRVVMDPATGRIVGRPSADRLARLGAAAAFRARRPAAELEHFDLPHGARGVALEDWADHAMRVERGADGSWRTVCSMGDSHEEAP